MQDAGDEACGAAPPVGAEAGAKVADFVEVEQAGDAEEKGSVLAGLPRMRLCAALKSRHRARQMASGSCGLKESCTSIARWAGPCVLAACSGH